MRRSFCSLAGVTVIAIAAMLAVSSPTHADTVSIEAGNLYFCDVSHSGVVCESTVTAGDTVTWNNVSGFHTVTECDDSFSTCPPAGGFDSGNLISGNTFSHTFPSPGVFAYHCTFHPTDMRGRITVESAPTATPTPTAAPTAAPTGTGATPTAAPAGSATPAAVPRTGGYPSDGVGRDSSALAFLILGGALVAGAGLTALRAARRKA